MENYKIIPMMFLLLEKYHEGTLLCRGQYQSEFIELADKLSKPCEDRCILLVRLELLVGKIIGMLKYDKSR